MGQAHAARIEQGLFDHVGTGFSIQESNHGASVQNVYHELSHRSSSSISAALLAANSSLDNPRWAYLPFTL
jgi:hypothetical protein